MPMPDDGDAVYLPTKDPATYRSSKYANAGWYDEGQHGGALAALIAGHLESVATLVPMEASRFTMELFRVVPLVPLTIVVEVAREGKRIQVIEARVFGEGVELTRAYLQRLRIEDIGHPVGVREQPTVLVPPEALTPTDTASWGHGPADKIMFHRHAIEVREIAGGFHHPGPGSIWMRLTRPIVAGNKNSALQRMLVTADFCNGISRPTVDPRWVFMNPDLTVTITRLPKGDWIGLDATSRYGSSGRGVATGSLWDRRGFLGRSVQTLYLDRLADN